MEKIWRVRAELLMEMDKYVLMNVKDLVDFGLWMELIPFASDNVEDHMELAKDENAWLEIVKLFDKIVNAAGVA